MIISGREVTVLCEEKNTRARNGPTSMAFVFQRTMPSAMCLANASSGTKQAVEIGAKVRQKTGGPPMIVVSKSETGYLVCEWYEGGTKRQRMFFPEMLTEEN